MTTSTSRPCNRTAKDKSPGWRPGLFWKQRMRP
jgi:hypothetical protein